MHLELMIKFSEKLHFFSCEGLPEKNDQSTVGWCQSACMLEFQSTGDLSALTNRSTHYLPNANLPMKLQLWCTSWSIFRHQRSVLDSTIPMRYSGLSNNAHLELVPSVNSKKGTYRPPIPTTYPPHTVPPTGKALAKQGHVVAATLFPTM